MFLKKQNQLVFISSLFVWKKYVEPIYKKLIVQKIKLWNRLIEGHYLDLLFQCDNNYH